MEKILREFSYLDSKRFGEICKLAFAYIDNQEVEEEIDEKTKMFFNLYVKKKLNYMMKQRERNKKNNLKNKKGDELK